MGSSRRTDPLKCIGTQRVQVHGSFRPNGSSGIVSGSTKGKGFSVARTSAGLYTITFDDKYPTLVGCKGWARVSDATPTVVQGGDYVAASKTMQLRVLQAATGATTLTSTLTQPKGFYPLDITAVREITSNDIGNVADGSGWGSGGILAKDTTPILERANAGTDKALRLNYATTVVDEVQFPPLVKPVYLDGAADLTVHLLVAKSGNTDTSATIDIQVFDGVGDTECGASTAALATASLTEYTATVALADLGEHPGFLNISLIPSAHANDAIYIYAAWAEFTQKGSSVATTGTITGQAYALADMSADVDNEVYFSATFINAVDAY